MLSSAFTLELGGQERDVQVISPTSERLGIKKAHVSGLVLTDADGGERHFTYNQLKKAHFVVAAEKCGLLNDGVAKIQAEAKKQRHAVNHDSD